MMTNKELISSLSEEVRQKLAKCRTQEEAKAVLTEAGIEPIDDELLDAAAGGYPGGYQWTPPVLPEGGVIV